MTPVCSYRSGPGFHTEPREAMQDPCCGKWGCWAPSILPCPQRRGGEPIWGPACDTDGTGKASGTLCDPPLPPTLLNLQQGLIFDTFPLPRAHRSPVAVLTAWAAKAGSALQPVGEQNICCGASGAALGWPERGAGSLHALPCPRERDEVGSSTGRSGGTGQDSGTGMEETSPLTTLLQAAPLQAAAKSPVSKATWGSHSWVQAGLGWAGLGCCPACPLGTPQLLSGG